MTIRILSFFFFEYIIHGIFNIDWELAREVTTPGNAAAILRSLSAPARDYNGLS
jgi:hypothetical protein